MALLCGCRRQAGAALGAPWPWEEARLGTDCRLPGDWKTCASLASPVKVLSLPEFISLLDASLSRGSSGCKAVACVYLQA